MYNKYSIKTKPLLTFFGPAEYVTVHYLESFVSMHYQCSFPEYISDFTQEEFNPTMYYSKW